MCNPAAKSAIMKQRKGGEKPIARDVTSEKEKDMHARKPAFAENRVKRMLKSWRTKKNAIIMMQILN